MGRGGVAACFTSRLFHQLPVFDMGPPLEELLERCAEETGLPAPKRPQWAVRG